uniref:Uncharacterized protein n=1 Tax=Nelumbo nucifera TaxID=4432 RepID=A0A822XW50_NELNU|nr:TPA_asm: hypothetical protein HUJ06_026021 [Nelumbo nucifera]
MGDLRACSCRELVLRMILPECIKGSVLVNTRRCAALLLDGWIFPA